MLPKRVTRNDQHSSFTDSERHLILAAETLRAGDTADRGRKEEGKGSEEKISVFWRVFGGTILSICALVILNLYQWLANGIHELRGDVGRLREAGGEYIKKDEFNTRSKDVWTRIQELQAVTASVTVLTNKLSALEQQLAAAERERKDIQTALAQTTILKDRLTTLEEQRKVGEQDHKDLLTVGPALAALRDRDAAQEKQLKDAETERKEVVRELQHLRERLAKLEGLNEAKPDPAARGNPKSEK